MPTRAALFAELRDRLTAMRGFALATINLDHLVKLHASETFRKAYSAQDLICADGNPIVWLARLAGKPVELIPGSDMLMPMARIAAEAGRPIALVGSTDKALEIAARQMTAEIPGLVVAYHHSPAMGFDPTGDDARRILQELADRDVGLCFIALGAPKQEAFAALGRSLAPSVGFAGIGAGLDFIAGHQTRAPEWMRTIAMEWLWRALSSPRRLVPRYLACAAILPSEIAHALQQRE